ncbi:hypothetical protein Q1695_008629 [Nippostrongylus brasiliensis]|nr:hypothetical protein Q1695_008629 [Nippostrongylus brasiliensis]
MFCVVAPCARLLSSAPIVAQSLDRCPSVFSLSILSTHSPPVLSGSYGFVASRLHVVTFVYAQSAVKPHILVLRVSLACQHDSWKSAGSCSREKFEETARAEEKGWSFRKGWKCGSLNGCENDSRCRKGGQNRPAKNVNVSLKNRLQHMTRFRGRMRIYKFYW